MRPAFLQQRRRVVVQGVLVGLVAGALCARAAPDTLQYQGYLTAASGAPETRITRIVFRLYDRAEPVGETAALWEEAHDTVAVTNGRFAEVLGSLNPFATAGVTFDQELFLELEIGNERLQPRIALQSVPYAFRAAGVVPEGVTAPMLGEAAVTAGKVHVSLAGRGLSVSEAGALQVATGGITADLLADGSIADRHVAAAAAISPAKIAGTAVTLAGAETLTGKTLDADLNHLTNIDLDEFRPGIILTDLSPAEKALPGAGSALATAAAIIRYVEASLAGRDSLAELADVALSEVAPGDVLVADSLGRWTNRNLTYGVGWALHGNAGTDSETQFLGTTDNQPLVFKVNGERVLRLESADAGSYSAPNVIAGHSDNAVSSDVVGATIAGGGGSGIANTVTDSGGTVGGGGLNLAGNDAGSTDDAGYATVGGGRGNTASGKYAMVAGGFGNAASAICATVGGGSGNTASGEYATVGGGPGNTASNGRATVGGGESNTASADGATVAGGYSNTASCDFATVGGGKSNTASGIDATVAGGDSNTASGDFATVGGGFDSTASGWASTVSGGADNQATGDLATVAGGLDSTASGWASTVSGGESSTAAGAFSLAAGRQAKANHAGTFVWADSSPDPDVWPGLDFASTGPNQFLVRAAGGVGINTNAPASALDVSGTVRATGLTLATADAGDGKVLTSDAAGNASWQPPAADSTVVMAAVLDHDGHESTLDADTLDSLEAAAFALATHGHDGTYVNEGQATSITTGMIVDGGVTEAKLADNAVTGAKIADGTIGGVDLSPMGASPGQVLKWNGTTWAPAADASSGGAAASWQLGGNAGTDPLTQFLGTTDSQPLEFKVNGARALRLEPTAGAPNVIGGLSDNTVGDGVYCATIAGGGSSGYANTVTDSGGTVGGGAGNQAGDGVGATDDAGSATVGGGESNTASGKYAMVAGGFGNAASAICATVGGGSENTASGEWATVGGGPGNTASNSSATVAGGGSNTASGVRAAVGGGQSNAASGFSATVGGGEGNAASGNDATVGGGHENTASGDYATVAGGYINTANGWADTVAGGAVNAASGDYATVAGGAQNIAGSRAVVGGGIWNTASGWADTVGGGYSNTASGVWNATVAGGADNTASGDYTTVAGGAWNTASGVHATVAGGLYNTASGERATVAGGAHSTAGGACSFAAGYRAKADHDGAFVWAGAPDFDFTSVAANEFAARATGGMRFVTAVDPSTGAPTAGVQVASGGGSWSSLSDRSLKANIQAVDGREVLERLAGVPVSTWNYQAQPAETRHMGPMAQDFRAAFGLGEDDKHITTVDADGVALAAIQGAYSLLKERDGEIADLKQRVARLEELVQTLVQQQARADTPAARQEVTALLAQVTAAGPAPAEAGKRLAAETRSQPK